MPTPYYQDDHVTIYHGDCREIIGMVVADVDCVVTDPPYGVGFDGKATKCGKQRGGYSSYDDTPEAVRDVVVPVVSALAALQLPMAVTPGTRCMFDYPVPVDVGAVYFPAGSGFSSWGFRCSQPIFYYGKDPNHALGWTANSVQCTDAADKNGHPCPKPIRLMEWLVRKASQPGWTVLDPFVGCGTTLRAAKNMGRKAIGIELDERYCEIAAERMGQEVLPLFG